MYVYRLGVIVFLEYKRYADSSIKFRFKFFLPIFEMVHEVDRDVCTFSRPS